MSRYRMEHRLAGWVVGSGWVLVMFALYSAIVAIVFAMRNGETTGFGLALQFLSYGLPMVLIGAACRAVFELAEARAPGDAETADRTSAPETRPADTP
jgi:uncharacterized membrane protein